MPPKVPAPQIATLALLAGMVAAFIGAIVTSAARPEPEELPPEHPLYGR